MHNCPRPISKIEALYVTTALATLIIICTALHAQSNSPTLQETLEWMHSAFPGSQSVSGSFFNQKKENAQTNSPTLKETLEWMHSAFPDSQSVSESLFSQKRELNYVDGKNGAPPSCTITIVDHWSTDDGKPVTRDIIVDLSLIDPDSIKWYSDDTVVKDTGVVTMVASNDKKVIIEKMENKQDDKPLLTHRESISFIGPEYARRFAKAFKNAVTLCGGKASTF